MMGAADGIWFVCPACGASNRSANEVCFLCGRVLDAAGPENSTEATTTTSIARESTGLVGSGDPPAPLKWTPRSFRISSLLWLIGLIAVCLGAGHEQPVVGIILAVAIVPAVVYTMFVAAQSEARGRPMAFPEKAGTFLTALAGVAIIEFSSLVAFVCTCFPAGFVGFNLFRNLGASSFIFAFGVGGTAAIAAGWYTTRYLLRRRQRRTERPWKP